MNILATIFRLILRLPIISNFLSGSILLSLSLIILTFISHYASKYIPFVSKESLVLISCLFSFGLFCSAFWSYGQKISRYVLINTFFSSVIFFILAFVNYKTNLIPKLPAVNLFLIILGVMVVLPVVLTVLTFRRKTFVNKSMQEIDNFGVINGQKNTKLAGDLFEEYIRDCFKLLGYEAYTTTELKNKGMGLKGLKKLSGDGGADVIATSTSLGKRLVIQCKHYSDTVGVEACYQALGALKPYNGTEAVVITNHFFTEEAQFNAEQNNILLIDRFKLTQLIAEASQASEKYKTEPMLISRIINKIKKVA